ncbi:AP-3 complex subunit beta-2 [Tribolium castaneum]|uniref:AP-3 complex subunit beta n=1 Tax=Tribolium castaneum TaxID=7070 RepID=D6W708_TRICA|nr:PREDICTED: AP-3 complex subunit beta-2 isoform X1 [Tribolium castaneum]EFA11431.2 AP-3 complex subunit beta-2-like Protein [Tribolium castaneum]|eukprot:XP_970593.2 PREDICTED: AP-3 complex subunit beta-2 isoform X1 [Tribolium castaneum]
MLTSSSHVSNNGSYSNDRGAGLEAEYVVDPASGGFFHTDFKKHDDLKEMLDSNKDSLKLEAMKRIIGMVAKGRDASMLFPAVVKNVVSKNIEVKKLVYVYLERYAEEQQDLALLSISTFQRALKEPNQLIRAGALRVLSSIRVKMISPIVMLAIRDASSDMSPYVRKTAAHAIPKLYSLENELKSELVTIIQKLLADKTVLVIGSAVMAFTEVCPERVDLIHQVYRKLCALLVDVDEWGQVTIVNMLTRYARMQFADPNLHSRGDDSDRPFYDSGSDSSEKPAPTLDPDHRLLLRSTRPLLQSRNAAVVMAVAQLYHHAAPKSESPLAAKAMVRLLRSHVEVQSVVLNAIASISAQNKGMFEAYLKSFFVRTSDPTNIKLLKLEILTNLTTDSNVSIILRELQTYISNSDKKFVAATIQAIGRCACSINEVTDSCLSGLVSLLSNRDEAVVAESVVVIKKLLQTQAADPKEIITHMARLLDSITVAQARAAILWLLGEHSQKVPNIAPDILRKLAKTFSDEHDIVKLQVMNLAVKLYITNSEQTALLCQYIFNLARYDQNYDIRDKARLFKQFIPQQNGRIASQSARIFLASKPAPLLQSHFKDHEDLQLGSLSHYIKQRATGYEPLPPFPENPPPGDVRNVEPIVIEDSKSYKKSDKKGKDMFLWESGSSRGASSNNSSDSSDSSSSSSDSSSEDSESQYEEESSSDEKSASCTSSEESSSEESEEEAKKPEAPKPKSNLDLLLDLGDVDSTAPVMTPSLGGFLTPSVVSTTPSQVEMTPPVFTNTKTIELINKINGRGLSATYRFTRTPHILSPSMANINIMFTNNTTEDISDIRLGKKNLGLDMSMYEFANIARLPPNGCLPASLGIDFNDTTQPANFEIVCSLGNFSVCIKPTIGELVRPVRMDTPTFQEKQSKLGGMNEHIGKVKCVSNIVERVTECSNLGVCDPASDSLRFAGQTLKSSNFVLVTITKQEVVTVNCENMVFGSVMLNELLHNLKS